MHVLDHKSLAHQLSMPNTPLEMAAIEKFMHSSYSVPWKIRTKRGCVTHPRSIAEKVRLASCSENSYHFIIFNNWFILSILYCMGKGFGLLFCTIIFNLWSFIPTSTQKCNQ
ncbi:unnamed protein product [Lupinus luteus]|uniref:Uncharacterized protein n=1 Tax=Lupinus luteus TaxID=3873 RepID=A0AAV1WAP4_LUPLU